MVDGPWEEVGGWWVAVVGGGYWVVGCGCRALYGVGVGVGAGVDAYVVWVRVWRRSGIDA